MTGSFFTAQPMTPELGELANDGDALEDALVWVCYATAEEQGYHPAEGGHRMFLYELDGDWWVAIGISVAEDAALAW